MWKNYLWGIFPYSYIPIHRKSNTCYLYTWWNMLCSIQRPVVTPLLLFSRVSPGPHFVISNYPQASPLATEIWEQHHDDLKSVTWDTLTRCLWWVEWCRSRICLSEEGGAFRKCHWRGCFLLTWYRHHLQSPWWMAQIILSVLLLPGDHKLCWKVLSVRTPLVQKLVLCLKNYPGVDVIS